MTEPNSDREKEKDDPAESDKPAKSFKVSISKGPSWTRFLDIEVPAERVTSSFAAVYEDFRQKAKIPGFRPGKTPMPVIKKRFADEVKIEVLESLVSEAYRESLVQEKIWPLGDPKVSDVDFDENGPLKFKAEIEVRPEIKLGKYKGFKVEKKIKKIGEKDVEESVEYLRDRMAGFEAVERPAADGDMIVANLTKKIDKLGKLKEDHLENIEILLGGEGILKEFQDGLLGMKIGEMKDILVKYPHEYSDNALAGNEITYTVLVKEIKRKILPELNDEFVAKVSQLKTVDEFKESLKRNIEAQAQDNATRELRAEMIKRVVEEHNFEVPISLLNNYLNSVVNDFKSRAENVDEKEIRDQYRPLGENMIRWNFLYYEIARAEDLKVTQEDRKVWIRNFARSRNISEEQAREYLGKSKKLQDIDESILESKALEYIIKNSEVKTIEK